MNGVLNIIKNETLTYNQQLLELANQAENTVDGLNVEDETKALIEEGVIGLLEGPAPYRPRYIAPDYKLLMEKGCKFLQLDPASDIFEATNNLLIFYKHVPSITSFPVFIGDIDALLDPFVDDENEAKKAIKLFLKHIDRTLTDSFVHGNIGPLDTVAGRIILECLNELECTMPNITLKYDKDITSDEFMLLCAKSALGAARPSFANHKMYIEDFKTDKYAIASCYNGFHVGGGGYTLVRLILSLLAKKANSVEHFVEEILPDAADKMLVYIDERARFLVEEAAFFKSNFLVKEGFISRDLFVGMFGINGLAEAVNYLLGGEQQHERYGYSQEANELGMRIIEKIYDIVSNYTSKYVTCFDGHHALHAQVGIMIDENISPGCRIPVGEEPEIFDHIVQSAPFHKYFYNGIGDVFVFEDTYKDHPEALVKIVQGAFETGIRYMSAYGSGCDLVRVTGYLAKRSEIEKLAKGEAVRNNVTTYAMGARDNNNALDRKVRG